MIAFYLTLLGFSRAVVSSLRDRELRGLAVTAGVLLAVGTVFYWRVEGWSVLDAVYFSVITLTTVGYGDLTPTTEVGKVFTILYILSGVGLLLGLVNAIAARSRIGRRLARREESADADAPRNGEDRRPGGDGGPEGSPGR